MTSDHSYLKKLIGKSVTKTDISTSTVMAIKTDKNESSDERMTVSLQLFLEDYLLNIYNPITIIPADKELIDFLGLKIIATDETSEEAELVFDNGYKIKVNMRKDAYYDPEGMCLYGPNNFYVVWN